MHHQLNRPRGGTSVARRILALVTLGLALVTFVSGTQAEPVYHGVSAGLLKVDQNGDPANTNVVVTALISVNAFTPVKGDWWTNNVGEPGFQVWNTADYYVQIGATTTDDVSGGVLISSVAQNGRQNLFKDTTFNPEGDFYLTNAYPISTVTEESGNRWRICSYRNPLQDTTSSAGAGQEFNVNVAGAWFPYTKYIGALVRNNNRTNGGLNNTLIGNSSLVNGTHFKAVASGKFIVDLTSLGIDSRTDGVLLVNGGKDENNYALAGANSTNGTWNVWVKDIAQPTFGNVEQDAVAFVFIPKTNTSLISGTVNGDGSIAMFSGDSPQFSASQPTSGGIAGRLNLKINGHSPSSGVLIISAENTRAGGLTGILNADNIVSYQPNEAGDGWQIQSRDTPGMGLQTPMGSAGEPEPMFSFVFVPGPTPGVTATPTKNVITTEAGATATFTVVLDALPAGDVTIPVSSSDTTEGVTDVSSLVFTPANWDVPQTVTVTGQDDAIADGQIAYNIVLGAITSSDARYNGMNPADVSALNVDNEAGITLSATSLTTTEMGGTATFTMVLNSAPTADVTVALSSSDTTEGTVSPASVTFGTSDWNTPKTVTVTGVNDFVDDGDVAYTIVTAAAASADEVYNNLNPLDVSAMNLDDDKAGVTLSTSSVAVSETGTTATFTVVLNTQPTANVVVGLTSSDTTEASVAPSTMTFTPANWNVPQTATVAGVDDFTNDGQQEFSIAVVMSGADVVYSALSALSVAGTTTDNEGVLTLPLGDIWYGIGSAAIGLDGEATIADTLASYNNGNLTVSIAGGSSSDRLEIHNIGAGIGEIGVSGSSVTYEGVVIGTVSGGTGTTPLVVSLNAAATPVAAQALLRTVSYRSTGTAPVKETRTVTVALNNGIGGTISASKQVNIGLLRVYEFQNGVDSGFGVYNGSADCELLQGDPDVAYPVGPDTTNMWLWVDYDNGHPQVLIRFADIIGNGAGQIPTNSLIVSAELVVTANSGNGGLLYRMLTPWNDETETWNSIGDGIQIDDVEARSTYDSFWGVLPGFSGIPNGTYTYSGTTGSGRVSIGVTPDVQAWANGATNLGWAVLPWDYGTDGTGIIASEYTNIVDRPLLRVQWVPKDSQAVSFRQGVNGYASAHDTQIRETNPDVNYATSVNLAVDFEVTSEMLDSQHVLVRFDDIIGSGAGQIPANSLVHAAVLEFTSIMSDSIGDGFLCNAILQPWDDTTTTWNSWNDGIDANGIDAAVTPTCVGGSAKRDPNLQSTVNSFDVTSDVQAWAAGTRANYGWALLPWPFGTDGWGFCSSETVATNVVAGALAPLADPAAYRPRLTVYFTPGALPENIVLATPTIVGGKPQLTFTGTAGRTYSVLRTGSLGGSWTSVGTATANSSGTATFTDNSPLPNAGFYRIAYP